MRHPPRIPGMLMRFMLSREAYECIAGDLDEAWNAGSLSRRRYWRLAIASISSVMFGAVSQRAAGEFEERTNRESTMGSFIQDLVYGARLLRRNPVFTAAAVLTLALGIGANTGIFSIVHVLLLEPLKFREPQNVAFVREWLPETQTLRFGLPARDLVYLQRETKTLEAVAGYEYWSANLTGGDLPERVQAYRVTPNLFELLDVAPLHGRTLLAEEGRPGGRQVAVLSYGLWRRRYASDPSIVGRDIVLDGRTVTVVGVMPRQFEFPVFNFKGELWAPMQLDPDAIVAGRVPSSSVVVVARVRSGVGYSAAQADVDAVMHRLERIHPDTNAKRGAQLKEIGAIDDEIAGPAMTILMCTVAVVLLLACANVANLLLARGVSRQRELAVRAALGAGRRRLVRQLLAESLLLALLGGAAGAAVAFVALAALHEALPDVVRTTQPNLDSLGLNAATLAFTIVLTLVTSAVFGLLPAFRAAGGSASPALREGAAAGGNPSTRRLRSALLVGEVTLATLLLVIATLLVRSYRNQQRIDPGFDAANVLTLTVTLPEYRYNSPEARARFFDAAAAGISTVPGVEAAGFVNVLPFSTYDRSGSFSIVGEPPAEPGREPRAGIRVATRAYLAAMGIPVRRGRGFDSRDRVEGQSVAIVNEAFVRAYLADRDPIGIRLQRGDSQPMTIVGVVGDVHHDRLAQRPEPEIYLPMEQSPPSMMMLAARTSGEPEAFVSTVMAEIQKIDPAQPVYHVTSLQQLIDESMSVQISAAAMMTFFSALALLLACIGIYGVIAYGVNQQQREFGVRLALGASRQNILRLVLGAGAKLVLTGIVLGAIAAFAASQLLGGMLYGVGPSDPAVYLTVMAILGLVGGTACAIPAWRASRTEPFAVLRLD